MGWEEEEEGGEEGQERGEEGGEREEAGAFKAVSEAHTLGEEDREGGEGRGGRGNRVSLLHIKDRARGRVPHRPRLQLAWVQLAARTRLRPRGHPGRSQSGSARDRPRRAPRLRAPPKQPTVLYCTVLYNTLQYCEVLCCTVLYYTLLYSTVLHDTVQELYCTVLYMRMPCSDELLMLTFSTLSSCTPVCAKRDLQFVPPFQLHAVLLSARFCTCTLVPSFNL